MAERLLDVKNLKTYFFTDEGVVRAVDGVDLRIDKAETLGVVGESGCGKTVTALSIMRLIPQPPGRIVEGEIRYNGRSLLELPPAQMRKVRGKEISMIFQEPMTSLNPVFTVGEQIAEALRLHEKLGRREAIDKTVEMLKLVHIPNPEQRVREYPHQLSGGMRQRVMIAMALSCNPKLLIADEPTTALDVTIQAQILELLNELKAKLR
ncbi:MAG: ABC transporter ATP-binding protein, partial [Candidatus Rokubacteria bacterium]|nr:ABC transporter ATP-binding protein [Candidatus Rokubacteria bacterium]